MDETRKPRSADAMASIEPSAEKPAARACAGGCGDHAGLFPVARVEYPDGRSFAGNCNMPTVSTGGYDVRAGDSQVKFYPRGGAGARV